MAVNGMPTAVGFTPCSPVPPVVKPLISVVAIPKVTVLGHQLPGLPLKIHSFSQTTSAANPPPSKSTFSPPFAGLWSVFEAY
jgi:hypothetical protein